MNTHDPEELLRDTLRAKALDAMTDLTVDDIRRDAAAHQRRTLWRTAGGLAAAAAVLVGIPAALYLSSGNETPSPAPSPSISPTVSPSSTPATSGLASIPRGKDPQVTYLHDGVVHLSGGGTTRLPAGATDVVRFTPYHGGWIVLDSVGGLVQYDNTGKVVRQGSGDATVAVSADQLRTAFFVDGRLYTGISNGMGGLETYDPLGPGARLVGFLGDRLVYNADGAVQAQDQSPRVTVLPGLSWADATSPAGNVVAGRRGAADNGIVVVSAATGRVLWTKPGWTTGEFSPDGKYLAAYQSAAGGELETVAILDARSGAIVATGVTPGVQAFPEPPTAWEDDDNLLIPYRGGSSWAVLRLSPDGSVDRASQVVKSPGDTPPFVFAVRP